MLKKWSRIALASVLVVMVGASVAFATTARVRSLGNTGDYISDDSAVNRWYSTLASFANQVNAEVGQWDGDPTDLADTRGLGWTHACGEDGKWGTYRISLNENALDHPGFWIGNPFYRDHSPADDGGLGDPTPGGAGYGDTPMNKWDLAGAWGLGESATLGVAVTQSKWSVEDTAADLEADNSWITLGAGFSWTNAEDLVIDAAFNFGNAGGTQTFGATSAEWDSKTAFDILGRIFWDWKDNVTLVPVAEFTQSDYSLSTTPALLPPNGEKLTDFLFGLGLNMDVNEDNMLVFALEYFRRKYEYSNPDTVGVNFNNTTWQYTPTVRLGLESQITSWFTTRIAAVKYMGNRTDETNGGDKEKLTPGAPGFGLISFTPPSGFDWFLGCGFTIAEWTIDLEINHETPFNIGYWLTGYTSYDAAGPVGRISAVYNY